MMLGLPAGDWPERGAMTARMARTNDRATHLRQGFGGQEVVCHRRRTVRAIGYRLSVCAADYITVHRSPFTVHRSPFTVHRVTVSPCHRVKCHGKRLTVNG